MALLCPDLLFGSRVEGALRAAGHEVERFDSPEQVMEHDVLVVDLEAVELGGQWTVDGGRKTVGFYPHVDQDLRRRAEQAGFDVVVPRSRMARETAAVVEKVLS